MRSWRSVSLALWAVVTVTFAGCSTTSIPARAVRLATGQVHPDRTVSVDRLVAIGRTFERQGNFQRAQGMYHLVLSHEPANGQASQGLQRIAELRGNNNRTFDGATPPAATPQQPATLMAQAPQAAPDTITEAAPTPVDPTPITPPPLPPATPESELIPEAPLPVSVAETSVPADPTPPAATDVPELTDIRIAAQPVSQTRETPIPTEEAPAPTEAPAEEAGVAAEPAPAPAEEEWHLPKIIQAPAHSPAGRVRLEDTMDIGECEQFHAPVKADCDAECHLEACLEKPEQHLDVLIASLDHASVSTRSLAAFLLGEAGPAAREAIEPLKHQLECEQTEAARATLAEAIGKIDSSDAAAKKLLLDGLNSRSADTRSQCAFALRVFAGQDDRVTLAGLETALSDNDPNVAAMAALSLSDFGAPARASIPALQAVRATAPTQVRDAVDAAISRISTK